MSAQTEPVAGPDPVEHDRLTAALDALCAIALTVVAIASKHLAFLAIAAGMALVAVAQVRVAIRAARTRH